MMKCTLKGDKTTMEEVFGSEPLDPFEVPKIFWKYIKTGEKRGKI